MSTVTVEVLEELVSWDCKWCHVVSEDNPRRALCGEMILGETANPHTVEEDGRSQYCPGCGRPNCPDCQFIWREMDE